MSEWSIRPADPDDADAVAEVLLASRSHHTGTMPPLVHSPHRVRAWVGGDLLQHREVWVVDDGQIVAVLALDETWLDHLYVRPEYAGQGIGSALLDLAKELRPSGFGLWAFVSNTHARRFYERRGLVEVERTDGSDNEEHAPDIYYAWTPATSLREASPK